MSDKQATLQLYSRKNEIDRRPDVLCPRTVIVNVQIIKYVTLVTGLDENTPNVDKTFHDLPTT